MKISAPFENVKGYAKIIPAFIAAARLGCSAYMAHRATILKGKLIFYLPLEDHNDCTLGMGEREQG